MADWTNLPNTAVGVGGLPSGTTVTALRDNPVAIAEGAAGSPLISAAMRRVQNTLEVGAYIFARGPSTTAFGDVVAGSSLTYAGAISNASASIVNPGSTPIMVGWSINAGGSGSPSGSWVCLGRIQTSASAFGFDTGTASATGATLWQRVS
jgi:hypothetical protein